MIESLSLYLISYLLVAYTLTRYIHKLVLLTYSSYNLPVAFVGLSITLMATCIEYMWLHAVDMMQPESRYQVLDEVCESVNIKFSYIRVCTFKWRCNKSNTNGLLCVHTYVITLKYLFSLVQPTEIHAYSYYSHATYSISSCQIGNALTVAWL